MMENREVVADDIESENSSDQAIFGSPKTKQLVVGDAGVGRRITMKLPLSKPLPLDDQGCVSGSSAEEKKMEAAMSEALFPLFQHR